MYDIGGTTSSQLVKTFNFRMKIENENGHMKFHYKRFEMINNVDLEIKTDLKSAWSFALVQVSWSTVAQHNMGEAGHNSFGIIIV